MRILLVEDNAMNVEFFRDALEGEGHEIVVEREGDTGEQRARDERFDLLILDVRLPGRSGEEVCRRLRAEGMRVPILGLSSDAMPDQISRGIAAGFDKYLTKPISAADLRAAVRAHAPPEPSG